MKTEMSDTKEIIETISHDPISGVSFSSVAVDWYPNTEVPRPAKDGNGNEEPFSEDVFTLNKEWMMNVAFYDYEMKKWMFHTDTLYDPYENGNLMLFQWFYKPEVRWADES